MNAYLLATAANTARALQPHDVLNPESLQANTFESSFALEIEGWGGLGEELGVSGYSEHEGVLMVTDEPKRLEPIENFANFMLGVSRLASIMRSSFLSSPCPKDKQQVGHQVKLERRENLLVCAVEDLDAVRGCA